MSVKSLALAVALAGMPFCAFAEQTGGVINYANLDAEMNAAQDEARSHLDQFLAHVLNQNGMSIENAGVKVAFPIGNDSVEVAWVTPFGMRDGQGVGLLANQPRDIEGLDAGDRVEFTEDQVRDWYVFGADGKMYGSYTTRVMLKDLTGEDAAQIADMLSDSPLPTD